MFIIRFNGAKKSWRATHIIRHHAKMKISRKQKRKTKKKTKKNITNKKLKVTITNGNTIKTIFKMCIVLI